MTPNPYLAQMGGAVTQQATQNLQNNILPGINSSAMAAGGFGGSRQGIAQANAIGQTNQGITNSLANMYGQAYDGDMNRANQMGMASMQNQTARDLGFGGLQNQRYGMDQNFQLGQQNANTNQYQAQTSRDLGQGQLGLANRQADQNYSLGQGNLSLGNLQANNSYSLGQQANANNAQANANQYSLGQGQNQNQATSIANQNANQWQANANTAQGQQNQYLLGLGQNQNQAQSIANQNANQWQQNQNQASANANQYNLGLGQLGLGQSGQDQSFYTAQRGQDLQQMQLGANMANMGNAGLAGQGQQLWNAGQQQQQAPWWAMQQFGNTLQPFSGMGGSTTQSTPGAGSVNSAMAGGLSAAQLWAMLNGGKP